MRARADALREVIAVFVLVTIATVLLSRAARQPPLSGYVQLAVGGLFLWTALQMSQRQPNGLSRFGLQLGGLLEPNEPAPAGALGPIKDLTAALVRAAPGALRELGVALAVAAAVFPPFVLGFYVWHAPSHPFSLRMPEALPSYVLTQLMVVALPEEALFRGYMQGRLRDAWPRTRRLLGVELSYPAWLLQAALFGAIHVAADGNPLRFAVFFPALLFGWLRALTGGIGAPLALHALCNLLSDILVHSWL